MAKKWIFIMLLVVFALLGCSDDNEKPQVAGASRSDSSDPTTQDDVTDAASDNGDENGSVSSDTFTLSSLPKPQPDEFVLPDLDITNAIAFSHEDMVYVAHFDGEQASLLTDTLDFEIRAKDGGQLIYTAMGSESPTSVFNRYTSIYIYDAELGMDINEILLPDDDHFVRVDGWSADGQWLTYTRFEDDGPVTEIVGVDSPLATQTLPSIAASVWLNDNTVVLFEMDENNELTSVVRYDPASDTFLDIDFDLSLLLDDNTVAENYFILSEQLSEQNLSASSPRSEDGRTIFDLATNAYVSVIEPVRPSIDQVCDDWHIETGDPETDPTTIYSVQQTHALTDLHRLPDDSTIFVRWFKSDCDFSEPLQAEVIQVTPDGTSKVIARDLYVNVQSILNRNFFRPPQTRMDVSADGRYMLWISQEELTRGDVALNLTDLTTGESAMVLITPEADGTLFRSVIWLD
jgi:hypothetical protein